MPTYKSRRTGVDLRTVFPPSNVVTIEPMTRIEFSKYGCFAQKHHADGRIEDVSVEAAMSEFDKLAASGAFER